MAQCWRSVDLSWPGLLGLILIILSLIFYAVAFGTTRWGIIEPMFDSPPFEKGYMGIMEYCRDKRCVRYLDDQFLDTPSDLAFVRQTRAIGCLIVVAILINFTAVMQLTFGIGRKGKAPIIRNVFFECCICGTMGLISMAVWANLIADLNRANILSDLYDFSSGSSFGLVVAAFFFNFMSAAVLLIESKSIVYAGLENVRVGGAGMI
eukprot:m.38602 g.38602  ORF g.38602 m.38602 type:complete len:207 (-) comp14649_c0_seq1:257-877(-)